MLAQLLHSSFCFIMSGYAGAPNNGTIGEFLKYVIVMSHDAPRQGEDWAPNEFGMLFALFVRDLALPCFPYTWIDFSLRMSSKRSPQWFRRVSYHAPHQLFP